MDVTRYFPRYDYSFNKKLLELLGLLPTARSKIRMVVFYLYYVSYVLFQTTWFFTLECDFACVVNILSLYLPNAMVLFSYAYHHKYMTTVHALYTAIELDWNFFKNDKQNIQILRTYARMVYVSSVTFLILAGLGIAVGALTFLTVSIGYIPKENYSCFWQRPVALKRFHKTATLYPSYFLCGFTLCITLLIFSAVEQIFLGFMEHVCALFRIAGSQLKRATSDSITKHPQCDKVNNIYTKIIFAVRVHTRAIKYLQIMWDTFEVYYACAVFCTISILITAVVSFYVSLQTKEDRRATVLTFYTILSVFGLAVSESFCGQRLIDHSSDVFYETYNSYWYRMPVKAQKMYLMILLRSIKSCSLSKGQLFVASVEGLSTILNTAFSYITVFYSVQK